MAIERDAIIRRLKAMKDRTEGSGCTEAETMEAASKLAELMDRYDIEHADLAATPAEPIDKHVAFAGEPLGNLKFVTQAVAHYTDTRIWRTPTKGNEKLHILGRETDRQLAEYLLLCFRGAAKTAWSEHRRENGIRGNHVAARNSFEYGMMARIGERLKAMKDQRNVSTGNALVVSKKAAVNAAFRDLGIRLVSRSTYRQSDAGARAAGQDAGSRVQITTGIRESGSLRIGH